MDLSRTRAFFQELGSLFKVHFSSYGYTFVANGVETIDAMYLQGENQIYDHLRRLKGFLFRGAYKHFMLMSYGGRPILEELAEVKPGVVEKVITVLGRLHQHRVLHCDAEPRNVLYDKLTGRCMIVDLMLAELHIRQPLRPINVNGRNRKRRWAPRKHGKDVFTAEAQSLRASLTP